MGRAGVAADTRHPTPRCPARPQYRPSTANNSAHWTTNSGAPVWNNNNSVTVGARGARGGGRCERVAGGGRASAAGAWRAAGWPLGAVGRKPALAGSIQRGWRGCGSEGAPLPTHARAHLPPPPPRPPHTLPPCPPHTHLAGPILLEDYQLTEKLANFDRERIPERVVHARGAVGKGFFEVRARSCVCVRVCARARARLWEACVWGVCVGGVSGVWAEQVAARHLPGLLATHSPANMQSRQAHSRLSHSPPTPPPTPPCVQVTHDVSHLTCADFLRAPGVQTPLITRFSTVIHERGSPETLRDPRGFAVKFYTREV